MVPRKTRCPPGYTIRRMIDAGTPAPDFELADQDGETVKLSGLRGKTVVLYFYPKADTPGCTVQACGVRDRRAEYDAADAVVLGVSPDKVAALRKFADKYGLPFTLLSDEDHAAATEYGAWTMKQNYGREYMGIQRSSFLVDPDGVVAYAWPKVKAEGHAAEVLARLTAAKADRAAHSAAG